ncbi:MULTISPECIES: hypothetical protein [Pseudoalteromonas]|uniref:Uncharacterized protein n=1 Tax=Pseudoalteromonas amylolytica TaxID=1859457 RepID=A0A1S1MRY9_9GAMM|nr:MULTISPECIES: hypothetical protein [Pseudoalteromonas]OHU86624.1 hypothetical protein BFC16_14040 [Pseudoalteromonas sp. JW3]OHU88851.1 hypothetical protein BET10_18715 [Pseudoalteromonas amylolytica]
MYRHTQFSWAIMAILAWVASFLILATWLLGYNVMVLVFAIILAILCCTFYALTIEVDKEKRTLSWWFGPGVAKKTLNFEDITEIKGVTNSFRHGVGMRITNDGWVYSASGFSAIEVSLPDGMKYRLGTNDQANLLSALSEKIASAD